MLSLAEEVANSSVIPASSWDSPDWRILATERQQASSHGFLKVWLLGSSPRPFDGRIKK